MNEAPNLAPTDEPNRTTITGAGFGGGHPWHHNRERSKKHGAGTSAPRSGCGTLADGEKMVAQEGRTARGKVLPKTAKNTRILGHFRAFPCILAFPATPSF